MKAYVTKNKEGKYCTNKFNENDEYIFTENLINADKYYEEFFAQRFCPEDCEVVEITITEGDLEKQLAEKDKEIKELKWFKEQTDKMEAVGMTTPAKINKKFDELKHQLAEKDKEIAKLRTCEFIATILDFNKLSADNCRLREQLAEKDKEIEELKKESEDYVIIERNFYNNLQEQLTEMKQIKEMLKQSHHQVCEEIRNFIKSNTVICGGQATREDMITSSAYNECLNDLRKCLDQIEQGEKK